MNAQAPPVRSSPRNRTEHARPPSAVVRRDSAWMACGAALSIGGGAPNVLMAYFWPQFVLLQPGQRATVLLAIDGLFCLSASAVLVLGSLYGVQRYGKHTQPYPGPFREATGKVSPFMVPKYMRGVVTLGGLVPVCAVAYLAWQGQATLGFCTLGVYVMQLFAQIKSEGVYLRKGSIMWPQVPQLYQTYRLWQLMRGCALTRALHGPAWLWGMQACLLLIWYFNFATVCTWMPWLYRWQLQPASQPKQQP